MRAYTWTDKALTRHAGRFVWLSLDMEKATNAPARKQLGITAFPTLYVVDPSDGHVAIRWLGGASIAQLERLFDDGELAGAPGKAGSGGAKGPALEALIAADRAYGAEKFADACINYSKALALAPANWPAYNRAVESLLSAYSEADSNLATCRTADAVWPRVQGTISSANVASDALSAAVALPDSLPERQGWLDRYEAACREVLSDPSLPLVGDDRSGIYFSLEDARDAAKDSTGMRAVQEEHVAMLESEASKAKSAEQRAVYDSHRLSLYIALGRPESAIPMLEQSRKDFPDDYNPCQRLASAYKEMKQWREALAASDAALARAYGPRQFLVLNTRADIQLGMGDKTAAQKTLDDALAKAEAMPEGQRSEGTISGIKRRIAKLSAGTN
jgi:tetratricopeptide (TPR) repeat protein